MYRLPARRGSGRTDRLRRRLLDDRGAVGGLEMLPFGFLVFVVGSLIIMNAWTVVDSWMAVSTASREGGRVFVESAPDEAWPAARARIEEVMTEYGRSERLVAPSAPAGAYERCASVTITVAYDMAFINMPFVGGFGSLTRIESTHTERIDPWRSGDFEGSCG